MKKKLIEKKYFIALTNFARAAPFELESVSLSVRQCAIRKAPQNRIAKDNALLG